MTWQPLAGWHTKTPVGPKGAQSRLQQSLHVPQRAPSTPRPLQLEDPDGGSPQVPAAAPEAMSQRPVQQSSARVQMSPCWTQNEDRRSHLPFVQRPEQHCALPVQSLPAVRHPVVRGVHVPPLQL